MKIMKANIASRREAFGPNLAAIIKYETMSRALHELLRCQTGFSASKAKAILGFNPHTLLHEGLRKTLDWVRWAYEYDLASREHS